MRTFIFVGLFLLAQGAHAQWLLGGGYYNLSDDEDGIDVSIGSMVASVGYQFPSQGNFSFIPELRVGFGLGDDDIFGVKVEVDRLIALSFRGQFDFDSGVYVFAAPAYADVEFKASGGGVSVTDGSGEFGIGGGVGFHFSDAARGEISYETYDGTDVFGLAIKFALGNR